MVSDYLHHTLSTSFESLALADSTEQIKKYTENIMDIVKVKKVKERIADNGFPSQSYGMSLAIWDHTVLTATGHK